MGGDLIWEIGSGYFGCREPRTAALTRRNGSAKRRADPQIRMVELKLSQGAKPGHGGVLPAAKVTEEIAAIRGVPMGQDCDSPASAFLRFPRPSDLLEFVAQMRELSGGKPAGFKLCIGHPWEFMAICKAMLETGITPGFHRRRRQGRRHGGRAAGVHGPCRHAAARRADLRPQRAGRRSGCATGSDRGLGQDHLGLRHGADVMALGADWCNAARGFMFAVGCIQAQSCHTGQCPTGVTTQDPLRQRAIVVPDKAERVASFHRNTLHALAELVAAAGLDRIRPS